MVSPHLIRTREHRHAPEISRMDQKIREYEELAGYHPFWGCSSAPVSIDLHEEGDDLTIPFIQSVQEITPDRIYLFFADLEKPFSHRLCIELDGAPHEKETQLAQDIEKRTRLLRKPNMELLAYSYHNYSPRQAKAIAQAIILEVNMRLKRWGPSTMVPSSLILGG